MAAYTIPRADALTGMVTYVSGVSLNWSDTIKVTDSDISPKNLLVSPVSGSAVMVWDDKNNNIKSVYFTNGAKSTMVDLVAGSGSRMHMDSDNVVWEDSRDGKDVTFYATLSSSKNALQNINRISFKNSTYCYVNMTAVCTAAAGNYTIATSVQWRGGDYSDIWGNLTGLDTGYAMLHKIETPYSYNFSILSDNPVNLDVAAMIFNDGSTPICISSPRYGWLACNSTSVDFVQSSTESKASNAWQPVIKLYNNDKYIFWIEDVNGRYGLYYTKILNNGTWQFNNTRIYDSYYWFELSSVVINNSKIIMWVSNGTITEMSMGTDTSTTAISQTGMSMIMDSQGSAILNGSLVTTFVNSNGVYYCFAGSCSNIDSTAVAKQAVVAANDRYALIAWMWNNGRLFYRLINATNSVVVSEEITGSHAYGDVSVAATGSTFHLAWIDNTDGYDKVFYRYLTVTSESCYADVTARCMHVIANNYTVRATATWAGGNFSRLYGNVTRNMSFAYTSEAYSSSPYVHQYNFTSPTATFNISLNAAVFVQQGGTNTVVCRSAMPEYWLACRRPSYTEQAYNLTHNATVLTEMAQSLRSSINSMIGYTMNNATFNTMVTNSVSLESLVDAMKYLNMTAAESGDISKLRLSVRYKGTTNVTNFFVYDVVPKGFAVDNDAMTITTSATKTLINNDPEYLFLFRNVRPNQTVEVLYTVDNYANVSADELSGPYVFTAPSSATSTTVVTTTINATTSSTASVYTTTNASTTTETTIEGGEDGGSPLPVIVVLIIIGGILFMFRQKVMFFIKYLTA